MNYVRNAWYVAAWDREIPASRPQGVTILEDPIAIWRDDAGQLHALEDRCVHRLAPLSLGRCEGANLRCMYHGFLFNPEGQVVSIPGMDGVPSIARVKRYPIVERDGWAWVWMGPPERADESLLPRVHGIDDPNWDLRYGKIDYAAEARLLNDNLTDFTHISYVHANSFGLTEGFASNLPTVTSIDRGVRIERWAEDQPPPSPDSQQRTDVYLTYDYLVPGILSMRTKLYPAGTFKRTGRIEPPDGLEILEMYSAQAVTPTAAKSTRYFFSNGARAPASPEFLDALWATTLQAFEEDRRIIEGQQRIIDLEPGRRIMPVVSDKATVLFNRTVDRLVKEEGGAERVAGIGRSDVAPEPLLAHEAV